MMDVKEVGMLVSLRQDMHVHLQGIMQKLDDVDSEAEAPGAQKAEAEADADAEAAAEEAPPRISSRCVTINAVINVA